MTAASRIRRRIPSGGLLLALALPAAAPLGAQQGGRADSAAVVTVLGRDTLGLERWVRSGNTIQAEAVVRTPRTSLRRYRMELGPDGNLRRFEERTFDPADLQRPVRAETLERRDAGWSRTVAEGDSTRTSRIEADARLLPFVDLVHWPYELVVERVVRGGITAQPLLMGNRAVVFPVARPAPDSVVVTHPNRGPSDLRTDAAGRLLALDGARTTRKVRVTRLPWVDLEGAARRWAVADREGRGVGELSARGREEAQVGGARILVDYGTPLRRGREIWGIVVPWGQRWRTGANRATHLTTDRPLLLGDPATGTLTVPAGEYTLFSVPAPEGGELIVNRQTGQTGTVHDPARDLGRVRMQRRSAAEAVERFTIQVAPLDSQRGELRLVWDRSAFVVPFRVAPASAAGAGPAAQRPRAAVPMDPERAALLYVSNRPEDHPQADFAAQIAAKARTDSIFAARSRGVMEYRKISYRSGVDGMEIPAYVFAPLQKRGARGHAAMVWIHGGVHGSWDQNYLPFIREAVQRGYVIVAPEYRGSTGYGAAHYNAIDYGGKEVDDVLSAHDFLRTLPHVDPDRVGVMGWSHGGFIAAHLLFRGTTPFRGGAAIVPVTNLIFRLSYKGPGYQRSFATQAGLRGLPFENREEYVRRSPYYHVDSLRVPLLVHVATNDTDVNFEEARPLVDALVARKPDLAETKIYWDPTPGPASGGHTFSRRVNRETLEREDSPEQIDSWNRTWAFFERILRPGDAPAAR